MKKVAIIGHFGGNKDFYDGQTIKTRIFAQEIEKALGADQVIRVDTYRWKQHPFRLLLNCMSAVRQAQNVLFLTDAGGIKIFPWLLRFLNFFSGRTLHYVVVGGWLSGFTKRHRFLTSCLKRLDYIWVETTCMKRDLEALNFSNIHLLRNFKDLVPLSESQLVYKNHEPYPFCTFSRVMKEKGIEDAVNAIKHINAESGRAVCTLDIYGAVDSQQTEWFEQLSSQFPPEVRYCGVVAQNKSVDVIKNYYALLFPTCYATEGIPGTIIDAYAAGVPVIAARWNSFEDMVNEEITGFGYPCLHNEQLKHVISKAIQSEGQVSEMKKQCLKKSADYIPANAIGILLEKL